MEQILSIVVRNQPGVLMRVAGMFSRRGFNIDSLAVGTTQNPEFSRMTVTMEADEPTIIQVTKQLAKLVEVERVKVLPPKSSATRSMILVKVKAGNKRPELLQLAEVFRAHAVDVTGESLIFVATGDEGKLRAFRRRARCRRGWTRALCRRSQEKVSESVRRRRRAWGRC